MENDESVFNILNSIVLIGTSTLIGFISSINVADMTLVPANSNTVPPPIVIRITG
jgi:hypothetical protein